MEQQKFRYTIQNRYGLNNKVEQDMLDYDRAKIDQEISGTKYIIVGEQKPTEARWWSFGWIVTDVVKLKTFAFNVTVECTQFFRINAKNKTEAYDIINESIKTYGSVNGSGDAHETDYNISDGSATSIDDIEDLEEVR